MKNPMAVCVNSCSVGNNTINCETLDNNEFIDFKYEKKELFYVQKTVVNNAGMA